MPQALSLYMCDFPRPRDPLLHMLLRSTTLSPQCPVGHATVLLTRLGPTYLQMQAFDFPGLCTPLLHLLSGAGPTWLSRISGMRPLGVASTVGTFGDPLSACNFFLD